MKLFIVIFALLFSSNAYAQTVEEYFNKGNTKIEAGDNNGAIQDYNKAIEINPKLDAAFRNRAAAKIELTDYQGAVLDYNKAIELNPKVDSYYNRGVVKNSKADYDGACVDWRKATELGHTEALRLVKEYCK